MVGACGIQYEHARRDRLCHFRQTAFGDLDRRLKEWVVATGVKNEDAQPWLCFFEFVEEGGNRECLLGETCGADIGKIDRQEIIASLDLKTVAGEIKDAYPAIRDGRKEPPLAS